MTRKFGRSPIRTYNKAGESIESVRGQLGTDMDGSGRVVPVSTSYYARANIESTGGMLYQADLRGRAPSLPQSKAVAWLETVSLCGSDIPLRHVTGNPTKINLMLFVCACHQIDDCAINIES